MNNNNLNEDINVASMMEALLFAAGEPTELDRLAEAAGILPIVAKEGLDELRDRLNETDSGLQLICLEGRYQLTTRALYSDPIVALLQSKRSAPLTQAALEVLAILAYHQPVSRGYIEQVRGTDSSSTVASLVAKGLVEEAGRLDLPGRPIVFRTTDAFLRCFGLDSLDDLPPLTELNARRGGASDEPDISDEPEEE